MASTSTLSNSDQRTLHVFGTFSQPSHITIGDKYTADKPPPTDDRFKGRQMLTTSLKKGRTDKQLFDKKYQPLASGTPYVDMLSLERKQHLEKTKEHPVKPFIPANPPKKSIGKGSLYGTIQKPPPHLPEGAKELKKGDTKLTPRNFLTSPAKKGGYGFYHTTIGGKEFEYQSEPYGGVKKKFVGQLEPKPITKPFLSTIYGHREFDPKIFSEEGIKTRAVSAPKRTKSAQIPFKSMTPMRDTIGKFPTYIIPEGGTYVTRQPGKDTKHEKLWKPSGTSALSIPQRSIALTGLVEHQTFVRSCRL